MNEVLKVPIGDLENTLCRDRFPNGPFGERILQRKPHARPSLLTVFSTITSELLITQHYLYSHGFRDIQNLITGLENPQRLQK